MDDAGRAGTGTWGSINLGASRAWWATVAVSLFILPPGRLPPELAGGGRLRVSGWGQQAVGKLTARLLEASSLWVASPP